MEKEKLLTIVIPAYNTEHFLKRCVSSMLHTKYKEETEILIVNDGSLDNTGKIADNFAKMYPNIIKVIHKENGGHGSAINIGIQQATGKYFKVIDSDDWVEAESYHKFLELLKTLDCDLIATRFMCINAKQNKIEKRYIEGSNKIPKETVLRFCDYANGLHIRMHECTMRTTLLQEQEITLLEHSYYVDMQYILYPIPWIKTFCILDVPIYCYRIGEKEQSVSIQNMKKNRKQHRMVLNLLVNFYKEREQQGDNEEVLQYLATGIAKMQADEVQILLSLPIGKKVKKELVEIEQYLKKECKRAYQVNQKKSIWLLRGSKYLLYYVGAIVFRIVKTSAIDL